MPHTREESAYVRLLPFAVRALRGLGSRDPRLRRMEGIYVVYMVERILERSKYLPPHLGDEVLCAAVQKPRWQKTSGCFISSVSRLHYFPARVVYAHICTYFRSHSTFDDQREFSGRERIFILLIIILSLEINHIFESLPKLIYKYHLVRIIDCTGVFLCGPYVQLFCTPWALHWV